MHRDSYSLQGRILSLFNTISEFDVDIPHWASHLFVIISVCYMAYGVFGAWCLFVGLWLWNPIASRFIYYYLPLSWQQNYFVYVTLLAHEVCWPAWFVVISTAFYCFWCADVFTMNSISEKLA